MHVSVKVQTRNVGKETKPPFSGRMVVYIVNVTTLVWLPTTTTYASYLRSQGRSVSGAVVSALVAYTCTRRTLGEKHKVWSVLKDCI